MNFKVGDKVILTNIAKWYGGKLKSNDKCVVMATGFASHDTVIWVCNTKGIKAAIYQSWASKTIPKNQQLLFNFME